MSNLIIVESPSKAKTIEKYLGKDYTVVSSKGHVRDLPKSRIGIDIEHDFAPQYINLSDKKELIKELRATAAESDHVYLATDPDREGEAISWHLAHLLGLDMTENNRVTFNEITKHGVLKGMSEPRTIDMNLVDAQQARRVLDRLVGYKLSPFLWKKVKRGLSAGRVQTVALKLVVDREKEIRAFVPEEFWNIDAILNKDRKNFVAKFYGLADGTKIDLKNEPQSNEILSKIEGGEFVVSDVKHGTRNRQPAPPFTTSTMQQEASRKCGFTGQRTMRVAQQLYEGVSVPGIGTIGLITYMRTDSLRISDEARYAATEYIKENFGENYLPKSPRYFKAKKGAQDAHEAIRPTTVTLSPDKVKSALTAEQYKLYKLIWERFVASLMANCVQDTVAADIVCNNYLFKASGYKVKFDGYTVLYVEGKDEETDEKAVLPVLEAGNVLKLKDIAAEQHFTQPPARYTEPTLIKAFEENGIGRPSTYASILSTINQREYVEKVAKSIKPTPLGETVVDLMGEYFKKIVDVKFTAGMEADLDKIADGGLGWVKTISIFYDDFNKALQSAESSMEGKRVKVPDVESEEKCELCGRNLVIKSGRFGKFLACPGYPTCKFTKAIVVETPGECPVCGKKMLQRSSKTGHKYYGCSGYPECKFMTWDDPTAQNCPECGKTLFRTRGKLHCLNEGCGYEKATTRRKKSESKDGENNEG